MQIQEKHLIHGAALTQIVEHESFKALNRAGPEMGHYVVNTDTRLLVKYSKHEASPWSFTFNISHVDILAQDMASGYSVFLCLVCGTTTVIALNEDEIRTAIDLEDSGTQWLRVELPQGGSPHVRGKAGSLKRTIPHKSYPSRLFS